VRTLRHAARDGRLPVTFDSRCCFGKVMPRATRAAGQAFKRVYYRQTTRWSPGRLCQRPFPRCRITTMRSWSGFGVDSGSRSRNSSPRLARPVRRWCINGRRGSGSRRPCSGRRSKRSPSTRDAHPRRHRRMDDPARVRTPVHGCWDPPVPLRAGAHVRGDQLLVHRPHTAATNARWSASTPAGVRFAVTSRARSRTKGAFDARAP
jgi:hypothetical protein